jgi:hypothetical protein
MDIIKKDNYAPFNESRINFIQFAREVEHYTGCKQNRSRLNFRLLDHQNIFTTEFTYFLKI